MDSYQGALPQSAHCLKDQLHRLRDGCNLQAMSLALILQGRLVATSDLTLIAELGRAKREALRIVIPTIQACAECDPDSYIEKKKTSFPGIGPDSLRKFHARARLLTEPGAAPYLTEAVTFPIMQKEVYFDIEADPMHGIVYLHGFVERMLGRPEPASFIPYFADGTTNA